MINVLVNGLPSTVVVGGVPVDINTDFRHCLQVSLLVDDPVVGQEAKVKGLLYHLYGFLPDEHVEEYLTEARSFLRLDVLDTTITKRPRKGTLRTFDWDIDQRRLVADFWREHRIDLTDPDTELHWWRFLALFEGLSYESSTMRAIGIRSVEIPKGASEAERRRLRAQKKEYELPARTKEEIEARERAIWGD
ncbi:MAG: bacteriophage Gp15 family protein [Coriobacteriales bacterium]|nr:bacteriophage Gp15 family protein [Coriobacteriales bacterium]